MITRLLNRIKTRFQKKMVMRTIPDGTPLFSLPLHGTKVYDIFIFFNELDLLEIRLNVLDSYVDYFVIVESTKTFSGKTKPLSYEEHKDRFKKWEHKIIHHITNDTPECDTDEASDQEILAMANASPHVPKGQTHWLREFYQKEMMRKPLTHLSPNDLCFISDIDEIWNPSIRIPDTDDIMKLEQTVYSYYLNNRSSEPWTGTFVTKYKNIPDHSINHLDNLSKEKYILIQNGGWHFTNMGGVAQIKSKIESYGHQEFNTDAIKSQIEESMKNNKDFIGRKFKFWIDESGLPDYILKHKDKYKHLLK